MGYIEAATRDAAASILSSHELFILSLEKIEAPKWYHSILGYFARVRRKDVAIFTRQFATMLEAKISIHDSLNTLYYQTPNTTLREAVFEISQDIDAGLTLSQSFEKRSDIFFEFYIHLIQSAEVTGQVERAMGFLADYLEREIILLGKVKNALIYPVFVVVLAFIVSGVLIGVVFPQITPLFKEAEFELPLITRIFLSLGTFIHDWWVAVVIFMIAFLFILAN